MTARTISGWWFSAGKTLPHGDGRRIVLGRKHEVKGDILPCKNGLHASRRAIDALGYAPGPIVWKVQLSGTIVAHDTDKCAASERTYIAGGVDVSDTLRKFARLCALDVINLWAAPEIVVRYLKTGDESIRDAARAAARATAAAARDAAWDAARDAAWDAAWAAADAAWATAGAAWAAQNRRLTRMLNAALRKATP